MGLMCQNSKGWGNHSFTPSSLSVRGGPTDVFLYPIKMSAHVSAHHYNIITMPSPQPV